MPFGIGGLIPHRFRLHTEVIYAETSIFSAACDTRRDPVVVDRRQQTRRWLDEHAANYRVVISKHVSNELTRGHYPAKNAALKMLGGLTVLEESTSKISDIVAVYLEHKLMPKNDDGDAWHLAMSSFHGCDYLLTWNCKHLANPNKFGHIRTINERLGLSVPRLVTPDDLLEEAPND